MRFTRAEQLWYLQFEAKRVAVAICRIVSSKYGFISFPQTCHGLSIPLCDVFRQHIAGSCSNSALMNVVSCSIHRFVVSSGVHFFALTCGTSSIAAETFVASMMLLIALQPQTARVCILCKKLRPYRERRQIKLARGRDTDLQNNI